MPGTRPGMTERETPNMTAYYIGQHDIDDEAAFAAYLKQITDGRCADAESLHDGGSAQADLPTERLVTSGHALAPARKLRGHALADARIVPGIHLWLSGCTW